MEQSVERNTVAMNEEDKKAEVEALRERFVFVCTVWAPARGTYEYLEKRTSIASSKWKNVFLCRQMPTVEMLIAICSYAPHYARWLMTGYTEKLSSDLNGSPSREDWEHFSTHRNWVKEKKKSGSKED